MPNPNNIHLPFLKTKDGFKVHDLVEQLRISCIDQAADKKVMRDRMDEILKNPNQSVIEVLKQILWEHGQADITPDVREAYRKAADEVASDGDLELDSDARISLSDDGGCYIQMWKWIAAADANVCDERGCHTPLDNGEGFDGKCGNCADREEPKDTNEVDDGSVCETAGCVNAAAKVVPVSCDAPGDGSRKICTTCAAAYSTGVQHGSFVQNPNYASEPPKPAEHAVAAKPSAPSKAKVGRTKKPLK